MLRLTPVRETGRITISDQMRNNPSASRSCSDGLTKTIDEQERKAAEQARLVVSLSLGQAPIAMCPASGAARRPA